VTCIAPFLNFDIHFIRFLVPDTKGHVKQMPLVSEESIHLSSLNLTHGLM
jgi:hypothetical protein